MPRKGYKTITVKDEIFYKFQKAVQEAKKADASMDNSKFIKSLSEYPVLSLSVSCDDIS